MVYQVVGIVSGTSKKGTDFRILHYLSPISSNMGSGYEGKSIFVPQGVSLAGIAPGDNCDLDFVPGYNNTVSLGGIKKIKESSK